VSRSATDGRIDRQAVAVGAVLGSALSVSFGALGWWLAHRSHDPGDGATGASLTDAAAVVAGGGLGLVVGCAVAAARSRLGRPLADGFAAAVVGTVVSLSVLLVATEEDFVLVDYLGVVAVFGIPLLAAGWLGANLGRDFRRGRVR